MEHMISFWHAGWCHEIITNVICGVWRIISKPLQLLHCKYPHSLRDWFCCEAARFLQQTSKNYTKVNFRKAPLMVSLLLAFRAYVSPSFSLLSFGACPVLLSSFWRVTMMSRRLVKPPSTSSLRVRTLTVFEAGFALKTQGQFWSLLAAMLRRTQRGVKSATTAWTTRITKLHEQYGTTRRNWNGY